jgi:hypothetical protein
LASILRDRFTVEAPAVKQRRPVDSRRALSTGQHSMPDLAIASSAILLGDNVESLRID